MKLSTIKKKLKRDIELKNRLIDHATKVQAQANDVKHYKAMNKTYFNRLEAGLVELDQATSVYIKQGFTSYATKELKDYQIVIRQHTLSLDRDDQSEVIEDHMYIDAVDDMPLNPENMPQLISKSILDELAQITELQMALEMIYNHASVYNNMINVLAAMRSQWLDKTPYAIRRHFDEVELPYISLTHDIVELNK